MALDDNLQNLNRKRQRVPNPSVPSADSNNVFTSFDKKLSRVNETTKASIAARKGQPPPKATDAPKGTTSKVFSSLTEALNKHQQQLVKEGRYLYADEYVIEFDPPTLGEATVTKPGPAVKGQTAMQRGNTAKDQADPVAQSFDATTRNWPVRAGTQIVQLIDQIMRSSSYITQQANVVIDENTGLAQPKKNLKEGQVAWYKINVSAVPLKYDKERRDFAYRIKYLITPFAINSMQSEYFPNSMFRGVHKSYQYWFTGENTQILNYEQDYNYLYTLTLSGQNAQFNRLFTADSRDLYAKTFQTASAESDKGAINEANEVEANAADYLYNSSDLINVRLRIIGDPAWLQQGEVASGVNLTPGNFDFGPFNADGTINFDSGQVVFDISWNRPADYNLNTGLAEVTAKNRVINGKNQPQENLTYVATGCKSIFSRGRFEQELTGFQLVEFKKNRSPITATPAANAEVSQDADAQPGGFYGTASGSVSPTIINRQQTAVLRGEIRGTAGRIGNFLRDPLRAFGPDGRRTSVSPTPNPPSSAGPEGDPQPQPAPAPQPPDSSGDIIPQTTFTGADAGVNIDPQIQARDA